MYKTWCMGLCPLKDGQVYLPISEMKDVYDVEIRNIEKTKVVTI